MTNQQNKVVCDKNGTPLKVGDYVLQGDYGSNQQNNEEWKDLFPTEQHEYISNLIESTRQSAAKEAMEQCKANCDANYNMGYAKGISTSMSVEAVKQETRKEVLREVTQIITTMKQFVGDDDALNYIEQAVKKIKQLTTK